MCPAVENQYHKEHQMFLQYMMSHGIVSFAEGAKIAGRITGAGADGDEQWFREFLETMNRQLLKMGLEIRFGFEETDPLPAQHVVLVNRRQQPPDDAEPWATPFDKAEVELLKQILKNIAQSESGFTTKIETLRSATSMPRPVKPVEAQKFLDKLFSQKWLVQCPDGLTLGCRAIVELEPMLREAYHFPPCIICRTLVIVSKGQHCDACGEKFHKRCILVNGRCPNNACKASLEN